MWGYFSPECDMNLFTEGDELSQNAKVEATGMPQIPRLARADGPRLPARNNGLHTHRGGVAKVNIRIDRAWVCEVSWIRMFIALRRVIFFMIYSPTHLPPKEINIINLLWHLHATAGATVL